MRSTEVSDMRGPISILSFAVAVLVLASAPNRSLAQSDTTVTRSFPWEGEVTGTSVYIRSGAGGNYYPTTKVGPGTRVLVVGEKFGWYEIVPPVGSFSYIDQSLVEKSDDGKTGIVSQENVYVRAGSELERRKTSTQILLAKGTSVSIIGEADGFYKIVPPRGANLFISAQYVAPVPERTRSGLLEKYMSEGGPVSSLVTPVAVDVARPANKTNTQDGGVRPNRPVTPVAARSTDDAPRAVHTDAAISPPADDRWAAASASDSSPVSVDVGRAPVTTPRNSISDAAPYRPSQPSRPVSDNGTLEWIESQFPSYDGSTPPPRPAYTSSETYTAQPSSTAATPAAISTPPAPPSPFATSPPSNAKTVDGRNITTIEVTSPAGSGRYDAEIQMLEAEMQSELRKPIRDQKLAALRDRFGPISIQNEDQVAKEIAKIRIRQLNDRIALQSSRMALAAEAQELEAYRRRSDEERMAMARRMASNAAPVSYDVVGELRKSAAFGPEKRRYRLVSPKSGTTIGYVDVPSSITTNVDQWVGQTVGVKAAGKNYSNAARMTFYVAESITPLGGGSGAVDAVEPVNEVGSDGGVIEFTDPAPIANTKPSPAPAPKPQPSAKMTPVPPMSEAKPVAAQPVSTGKPTLQTNASPRPMTPAPQPAKPTAASKPPVSSTSGEPIESDDPAGHISFDSPTPMFSNDSPAANRPASLSGGAGPASSNSAGTGNTPPNRENTEVEPLDPLD